jgi:hypothetical protein
MEKLHRSNDFFLKKNAIFKENLSNIAEHSDHDIDNILSKIH